MRILHVLPTRSPIYGGPARVADALVRQIRVFGHEARLFPEPQNVRQPDSDKPLYWPGWVDFRKLVKHVTWAEILHIHGLWNFPTSVAATLARRHKRPYLIMPHEMITRISMHRSRYKKRFYSLLWEKRNLGYAAALHFLNDEELVESQCNIPDVPKFVLANGADVQAFNCLPNREVLEIHHPIIKTKTVALFLGRIHPKKGLDLLVPALSNARKHCSRLHLLIAGPDEGGYRAQVESLVREQGVEDAVTFLGEIHGRDKFMVLGGSDFFVLTSYHEGDSMAVKEALASGLPVLITNTCHFPEVALEKVGIIVQPAVNDIAQGLLKLCNNKQGRLGMGQNGRRLIKEHYRWDVIVKKLLGIYEDIYLGRMESPLWVPKLNQ